MSNQGLNNNAWVNVSDLADNEMVALLSQVLGNLPAGIFVSDTSGKTMFYNRFFSEMFDGNPAINNLHSVSKALSLEFSASEDAISKLLNPKYNGDKNKKLYLISPKHLLKIEKLNIVGDSLTIYVWVFKKFKNTSGNAQPLPTKSAEVMDMNAALVEKNVYLQELNAHLEKLRTELTNANNSKDKFLSVIAHDLKSPFQGLLGMCDVIIGADDISYDNIRSYVGNIKNSASNIYSLIEKLLQWSRIQLGSSVFKPVKCDLQWEVSNAVNLFRNQLQEKNISVDNIIEDNTFLFADENMIGTIIRNLISNSIKFSYYGGLIKISCQSSHDFLTLIIEDHGTGIPEENLNKLISSDEIITTRGTENEEGSGLGLILVNEMVKIHGGTIRIESTMGQGSAFYIEFPNTFAKGQLS